MSGPGTRVPPGEPLLPRLGQGRGSLDHRGCGAIAYSGTPHAGYHRVAEARGDRVANVFFFDYQARRRALVSRLVLRLYYAHVHPRPRG